jgi:hypothetical protein
MLIKDIINDALERLHYASRGKEWRDKSPKSKKYGKI